MACQLAHIHTCCSHLLLCAISHLPISFRADSMSDMHKVSVSSKSALTRLHTTGMLHPQSPQYAAYLSMDMCTVPPSLQG